MNRHRFPFAPQNPFTQVLAKLDSIIAALPGDTPAPGPVTLSTVAPDGGSVTRVNCIVSNVAGTANLPITVRLIDKDGLQWEEENLIVDLGKGLESEFDFSFDAVLRTRSERKVPFIAS